MTGALGQLGKRVSALLLSRGNTVAELDLRNSVHPAIALSDIGGQL